MLLVGCSPGTAGVPLDGLGACRRRYYILYNVGLGTRMVWDGVDHVTVRRTYLFTTLKGLVEKVHTFDTRGHTVPLLRRYDRSRAHRDRDIVWL